MREKERKKKESIAQNTPTNQQLKAHYTLSKQHE